ncbi:hypothetical protein ZWY2020_050847 [Hordeum vulgare]|nr:hypothetical protein ZWY2020_050847 [Hordeum vulgare]
MTTPPPLPPPPLPPPHTRANSLSRILSSSSPVISPPKRSPKTQRAPTPTPTPKPPAADAASIADQKLPKPLGPQPLGVNLKALIRERDPDKLVSKFVQASSASPGFRDRPRAYMVAVSRLASLGRRDGIEAIIDAQKPFLETSTEGFATRLIRLYGGASMPSHAAATFHQLPAQHKSTRTFNAVLAAYSQAGDLDALTAAFQEIPATHPSIVPTVYSYNVLIRTLCHKSDLSAALDAVLVMEKRGVSPDIVTFNTLLNGFCNNGRVQRKAETVWR